MAAACSPIDLAAGGHAIGRGFNRQIYTRMFMRTLVPKALGKLAQHPGLFDRHALLAARDLYAFDNVFTAPLHGFRDTEDYWQRASAKPVLHRMAYGRDKHDDYYLELKADEEAQQASLELHEELSHLRHDIEALEKKGQLPETMRGLRERLARLEHRTTPGQTTEGAR